MNLSITPELQKLIQRKVDSGLYANASEVVRDALRRMDERPISTPGRRCASSSPPASRRQSGVRLKPSVSRKLLRRQKISGHSISHAAI